MNFKDIKVGYPVYLLDKQNVTFHTEKVTNISLPHIDAKVTATSMVVDLTTEGGTYCMMADIDIAYPYNKVITTERNNILREVEALKATAEQLLAQVDRNKETVTKCNELIAELDPAQKEKQANEARFSNIEASINQMMTMLQKLTE